MAEEPVQPIIIKKKKVSGHGHHGGAWKVAYADFVTAMMAFFLVMWIIGLDVKTRSGLAEYFSNPGAFPVNFASSPFFLNLDGRPSAPKVKIQETTRRINNVDEEAANRLKLLLENVIQGDPVFRRQAHTVDMRITDIGLVIDLVEYGGGTFFEGRTAQMKSEAKRLLLAMAEPIVSSRQKLVIEGHTDIRPMPTPEYGLWELGHDRAQAVRRSLAGAGMPDRQVVEVTSKAATVPRNQLDFQAMENNRVRILVPFTREYTANQ